MSYIINGYRGRISQLSLREVYRYMGAVYGNDSVNDLLTEVLPQFLNNIDCKSCYMVVPVSLQEDYVDLDLLRLKSAHLAENLSGCSHAILFAATIGTEADRQRRIASVTSPTKALILDAMGSAAIEAFCDELCEVIKKQYCGCRIHPRFSPGYGDLPLECQRELLGVLDAHRRIGLTLSDTLMMLPQKSVTAIMGIEMPAKQ